MKINASPSAVDSSDTGIAPRTIAGGAAAGTNLSAMETMVGGNFAARCSVLRFPLIVLVVAIHSQFSNNQLVANPAFPLNIPFLCCFPHTVVPFFFLMSGFFMTWKLTGGNYPDYRELMRKKFFTLFLPYLLWNTLYGVMHVVLPKVLGASKLLPNDKYFGMNLWQIFVQTYGLGLETIPIDVPLWFVKDLMVFFILSPLLLWLIYKCRIRFLLVLILLLPSVPYIGNIGYIMLGMVLGCRHPDIMKIDRFWWVFCLLFLAEGLLHFWQWDLSILLAFPLFYTAGGWLLKCRPGIRRLLESLGNKSFWIFCLHGPIATTLLRIMIKHHYFHLSQFVCYLAVIVLTVLICLGAFYLTKYLAPHILSIATGKRNFR